MRLLVASILVAMVALALLAAALPAWREEASYRECAASIRQEMSDQPVFKIRQAELHYCSAGSRAVLEDIATKLERVERAVSRLR